MRKTNNPVIASIRRENARMVNSIKNCKSLQTPELRVETKNAQQFLSQVYRSHHIAYCELRGRMRDEIEKPAENNIPNEQLISNLKVMWNEKLKAYNEEVQKASEEEETTEKDEDINLGVTLSEAIETVMGC